MMQGEQLASDTPMDSKTDENERHFDSGDLEIKESRGFGLIPINLFFRWFGLLNWWNLGWCQTSMSVLRAAEKRILSYVKTPYRGRYINVGPVVGTEDSKLWTLAMNEKAETTPIVLLHGLGAGVALWALNFDGLASSRPVYALDLLGFGRSSRPNFSSDAKKAENELVTSIEEWRREMKLERFALLGHSMGGFLATSYAMRYPERVSHLILADPWGFPERPVDSNPRYPIPYWVKAIAYVLQPLNPLWGIRAAGPMGPKLIEKARPDLIKKYASLTEDRVVDAEVANYIFHCNAQNPTGESAFHAMMSNFGWAKFPMCNRISELRPDVPLTMIYGSRSWVDNSPADVIKNKRPNSYVNVEVIHGAGHHVYADKKDKFNDIVKIACAFSDERDGLKKKLSSKSDIITNDDGVITVKAEIETVNIAEQNKKNEESTKKPAAESTKDI